MTMIATTRNFQVPFLISDLLISSKQKPSAVHLPSVNRDVTPYLNQNVNYHPETLYQKLHIIQKNVAALFTGKLSEFVPFIRELKTRCSFYGEHNITKEHIDQFIDEQDINSSLKESGFLLMLVENKGDGSLFFNIFTRGYWRTISDDDFEFIDASGSGATDFINHFKQPQKNTSSNKKGDIARAMQLNLGVVSKLLAVEHSTLHNLQSNWGGGFEVAYYNGYEFEKLGNVIYIIWEGAFDANGDIGFPNPKIFNHYRYVNDKLYITSIEVGSGKSYRDGDIIEFYTKDIKLHLHIVPSIDITEEVDINDYPKDLSFSTNMVGQGFAIKTPTDGVFTPSMFSHNKDIRVEYVHGKSLSFRIHSAVPEMIRTSALEVWPHLKKEDAL